MAVWFSIQIAWKTPLKTNSSPGILEFTNFLHGILFFQGWPGILHPSPCLDIKWNMTFNDIKMHFKTNFNTGYCFSTSCLICLPVILSHLQDQDIIVFLLIFIFTAWSWLLVAATDMVVYTVIYCITHRPRSYTVQNSLSCDPSYKLSNSYCISAALHTTIECV